MAMGRVLGLAFLDVVDSAVDVGQNHAIVGDKAVGGFAIDGWLLNPGHLVAE